MLLTKPQLRRELLRQRAAIADKAKRDGAIFEELAKLPQFMQAELVLTYVSTGSEADTMQLIGYCLNRGTPVAIPGIVNGGMSFFELKSRWELGGEIDFAQYAQYAQTATLCVVPGLAFDKNRRRLGYGGGYYDRFLRDYRGYKVGLCYKEFLIDIPVEEHDEKVDLVLWG